MPRATRMMSRSIIPREKSNYERRVREYCVLSQLVSAVCANAACCITMQKGSHKAELQVYERCHKLLYRVPKNNDATSYNAARWSNAKQIKLINSTALEYFFLS